MKTLLTALFTLALAGSAFAEVTAEHKALLQKYFKAVNQEQTFTKAITNTININPQQLAAMPPEQQAKIQGAFVKVRALLAEKMTWAVVEDEMIAAFATKLSVEDLKVIVPGLENPGAKLYFQKMADLLPLAQQIGQSKVQALQPEIQKIMQAEMSK